MYLGSTAHCATLRAENTLIFPQICEKVLTRFLLSAAPPSQQLRGGRDGLLGHGAGRGAEEVSGSHSGPGRSPEGGTSYRGLQVKKHGILNGFQMLSLIDSVSYLAC